MQEEEGSCSERMEWDPCDKRVQASELAEGGRPMVEDEAWTATFGKL